MSFLDIALIVLSTAIAYIFLMHALSNKQESGKSLPRPAGWPILGNALSMSPDTILSFLKKSTRELGRIYELKMLFKRVVVISDPKLIKEIMAQRPKVFRRPPNSDALLGRPNHSLFNSEGEEWSRLRRLMAPAFSLRNVDLKTGDLISESFKLVERLRQYENTKEIVDMEGESQNLTVRVISQVALGGEGSGETQYFYGKQFAKDLQDLFRMRIERSFFPYPQFIWRLSSKYKYETAAKFAVQRMDEKCQKVIEERRKLLSQRVDGGKESGTMLDILIRHSDDDQSTAPITDMELLDNVKLLYVAGSETTSISICWALYYLSLNPHILAAVRLETDKYVCDGAQGLIAINDNVCNVFKYTHAVMKEALRLGSPVAVLSAKLVSGSGPVRLSNDVVLHPSDGVIIFDVDSCLRDEQVFTNAEKFNPDRWLTDDKEALEQMELSFLTFGSGRRICPGMGLAHSEAAVAVAVLVHHYDFELACRPEEVKRVLRLTTKCESLPMFVKTRATK